MPGPFLFLLPSVRPQEAEPGRMTMLKFAHSRLSPSPDGERTRQILQTVCMALVLAIVTLAARLIST
jgi:hypothetical protein